MLSKCTLLLTDLLRSQVGTLRSHLLLQLLERLYRSGNHSCLVLLQTCTRYLSSKRGLLLLQKLLLLFLLQLCIDIGSCSGNLLLVELLALGLLLF